jgi:hypothetical protein
MRPFLMSRFISSTPTRMMFWASRLVSWRMKSMPCSWAALPFSTLSQVLPTEMSFGSDVPKCMHTGSSWANDVSSIQSTRRDGASGLGSRSRTTAPAPSDSIQRRKSALKYWKPSGTSSRSAWTSDSCSKRPARIIGLSSSDPQATARSWRPASTAVQACWSAAAPDAQIPAVDSTSIGPTWPVVAPSRPWTIEPKPGMRMSGMVVPTAIMPTSLRLIPRSSTARSMAVAASCSLRWVWFPSSSMA